MIRRLALLTAMLLTAPAVAREPEPAQHARVIAVEGARNFRDAGGYRTADGRRVKWGMLYRSGSLAGLTPQGMRTIDRLGIGAIIDLRMTAERRRDASNWLGLSGHGYWTQDYELSGADAGIALGLTDLSAMSGAQARAMMAGSYRRMPRLLAPHYLELFARLAAPSRGPVVVNCTGGKDRTGIATALVLTALGVPYAAVRKDYLLSNDPRTIQAAQRSFMRQYPGLAPETAAALLGVEGEYLDAAFDQIRQDYGSIDAYLQRELGVGPGTTAALKRRMLERS